MRRPTVLFLCVQNAGRSQMAAAWAESLGGGRWDVRSAGSRPARHVHPEVVRAMDEVGIDLAERVPRRLTPETLRDVDLVVTMGCGDRCPVDEGTRVLDWPLADPHARSLDDVRRIRDEIRDRVESLLADVPTARGYEAR